MARYYSCGDYQQERPACSLYGVCLVCKCMEVSFPTTRMGYHATLTLWIPCTLPRLLEATCCWSWKAEPPGVCPDETHHSDSRLDGFLVAGTRMRSTETGLGSMKNRKWLRDDIDRQEVNTTVRKRCRNGFRVQVGLTERGRFPAS